MKQIMQIVSPSVVVVAEHGCLPLHTARDLGHGGPHTLSLCPAPYTQLMVVVANRL